MTDAGKRDLPLQLNLLISTRFVPGPRLKAFLRTDQPIDGNKDFQPATRPRPDPPAPASAEQAYIAGVAADKKSDERAARSAYQEALRRDANFAPALIALGLSYHQSGEDSRAVEFLEKALRRDKDAPDAHYYLGLAYRALQKTAHAREEFEWCVRRGYRESVAHYLLGEMDIAEGAGPSASLVHFRRAVLLDPRDVKAKTLLALAERRAGNLPEAQARIEEVIADMPLDYLARREMIKVYRARGAEAKARGAEGELWRILDREPDSVFELAAAYFNLNLTDEAHEVLSEAIDRS